MYMRIFKTLQIAIATSFLCVPATAKYITLTKDEVKNITVSYMRYEYRVEVEGDEGVDTTR